MWGVTPSTLIGVWGGKYPTPVLTQMSDYFGENTHMGCVRGLDRTWTCMLLVSCVFWFCRPKVWFRCYFTMRRRIRSHICVHSMNLVSLPIAQPNLFPVFPGRHSLVCAFRSLWVTPMNPKHLGLPTISLAPVIDFPLRARLVSWSRQDLNLYPRYVILGRCPASNRTCECSLTYTSSRTYSVYPL